MGEKETNPRIFIGPMSINIVNTVAKFCDDNDMSIGLIPSRRQVEYDGGYVNNWTTKEFVLHARKQSYRLVLQRDHGGPRQGTGAPDDDGMQSFLHDCISGFDLIHIDPWKKTQSLSAAIKETATYMKFCNSLSTNLRFEVGTEEAIRKYEADEFNDFLIGLKKEVGPLFDKVEYGVIQFGTRIEGIENIGEFDEQRCMDMIEICKNHNIFSKEHNGDYLSLDAVSRRYELGLDGLNIAPEFGSIESCTILGEIQAAGRDDLLDQFYQTCVASNRWKKWVPEDFQLTDDKKPFIIKLCGHYVFSTEELEKIKK